MIQPIRILHVEDVRSDADLVKREMKKVKFLFEWLWVSSKVNFQNALAQFVPDIILCDHTLPDLTSVEAFKIMKGTGLNIPFILITGTISEEFAVMMMKEGVSDYLLKDRIQRLPVAIIHALDKRRTEKEKEVHLEEVIRNEKRFRGLIENSNDLIALLDQNLDLTYTSPNYFRITGRTSDETALAGVMKYIHPLDQSIVESVFRKSLNEPGKYFSLSYRLRHQTGDDLFLDGSVINLLCDESIHGIVLNVRDITQRKKAEESLRKSEASLNAIIENSEVHIYSLDKNFRYVIFNSLLKDTLKQIYGLDINKGDGVYNFLNKLDPEEAKEWQSRYAEALSGKTLQFVKEFKVGDYHSFTSFSINPIREGNNITGLSCFARDITAEKLAAGKIKQSEARFRALIENNYDAITLRDENLSVIYRSPSAKKMIGYDEHEFIDDAFYETVHPDDLENVRKMFLQAKENPGKAFHMTVRAKHRAGHYIWIEGVMRNMLLNESVKGIIFNYRDISQRKESELQHERMTADILQRNKDLEQFAYIISHNLRAPVANILGISTILEFPHLEEPEKKQLMDGISSSARKLDEVIIDLNNILQRKQENITENKQMVCFQLLIDDINSSISHLIKSNNVKITTDFTEVSGMQSIKSYLYSIFYNLISNSIKYRQAEISPAVDVRSFKVNNKTGLSFKDNGIGIDLEIHGAKVFGLYKRFHLETEGKGMGLFMVKTQVEALGGNINISSELNRGTEFTITL